MTLLDGQSSRTVKKAGGLGINSLHFVLASASDLIPSASTGAFHYCPATSTSAHLFHRRSARTAPHL